MKRTIALKIILSDEERQMLFEMQSTFAKACNRVSEISNEHNRVKLHHLVYHKIRKEIPEIGSQMVCNAVAKVSASRKALKDKQKQLEFRKTTSVHYDKRTYSFKMGILSLFTLRGRKQFTTVIGDFQRKYLEHGKIKEAELVRKGKRFFFHLVLDLPDPKELEKGKMIAVDIGENNIAVISTGKIIKGGKLKKNRDQFLERRKRLQSKGSQSAKRRLRQISGRERRHVKYVNHCVSKVIVQEAMKQECSTIILENLKNIRKRIKAGKKLRSRLHRWPFHQLRQFVEYKAKAQGIRVIEINPAFTSQTCSVCLQLGERQKHRFSCSHCGSRQHSDLNASRNILRLGQSADRPTGAVSHRHVAV